MENEELEKQVIEIAFNKKDKILVSEVFTKIEKESGKYSDIIISKEQAQAIINHIKVLDNVIEELLEGLKADIY